MGPGRSAVGMVAAGGLRRIDSFTLGRLAPFTALLPLALGACLFEPPAALPPLPLEPKDASLSDVDPLPDSGDAEDGGATDRQSPDDVGADGGGQNLLPLARADSATTALDTPIDIAVLSNDSDPDGDVLTVLTVDTPANGTAAITASGIRYTPPAGYSGTQRFNYRIGDGRGGEASAEIRVFVMAEPLLLLPMTAEINLNSRGSFSVSGGVPPYSFRIATGNGEIDANTGTFFSAGVPGSARVVVEDARGNIRSSTVSFGNGDLFFIGGWSNGDEDEVFRSNDGVTFQTVGSLNAPLYLHSAVVFEDRILVAGGRNESFDASELLLESSNGASFTTRGTLPAAMRGTQLVVFNQRLYLLGGRDQLDNNRSEVWSSTNGITWVEVGQLPEARAYGSAFVHQGRLWYAGGWSATADTEIWSTTDGLTWTTHSPLPAARYFIASAVHEGQIWLIGGSPNGDDGVNDVLRTASAMSFANETALPANTASACAISWRTDLWVVGGGTNFAGPGGSQAYNQVLTRAPNGAWVSVGTLPGGRFYGAMVIYAP